MTRVLPATCSAQIVTVDNFPVASAEILSEGNAESEGVLLLDKEKAVYITSNASDIKNVIEKCNAIIEKIISALSTLDGADGKIITPTVLELQTLQPQFETLKDLLK